MQHSPYLQYFLLIFITRGDERKCKIREEKYENQQSFPAEGLEDGIVGILYEKKHEAAKNSR